MLGFFELLFLLLLDRMTDRCFRIPHDLFARIFSWIWQGHRFICFRIFWKWIRIILIGPNAGSFVPLYRCLISNVLNILADALRVLKAKN